MSYFKFHRFKFHRQEGLSSFFAMYFVTTVLQCLEGFTFSYNSNNPEIVQRYLRITIDDVVH